MHDERPAVDAVTAPPKPSNVLVLLAAYNGIEYLKDQIESIMGQTRVSVRILISVDASADGTEQLVVDLAAGNPGIDHLPFGSRFGGAAPNFFRLINACDVDGFDYVAFSDQDDVWLPDKLSRATEAIDAAGAAGYSSDAWIWGQDGSRKPMVKSQRQRDLDYLFSSPGPGCTQVFPTSEFREFRDDVVARPERIAGVDYHDWVSYAWVRGTGRTWVIDGYRSLLYRQHGANQLGANTGWRAAAARWKKLRSGWYEEQVLAIADAIGSSVPVVALIRSGKRSDRLILLRHLGELRRTKRDRLVLAVYFLISALLGPKT